MNRIANSLRAVNLFFWLHQREAKKWKQFSVIYDMPRRKEKVVHESPAWMMTELKDDFHSWCKAQLVEDLDRFAASEIIACLQQKLLKQMWIEIPFALIFSSLLLAEHQNRTKFEHNAGKTVLEPRKSFYRFSTSLWLLIRGENFMGHRFSALFSAVKNTKICEVLLRLIIWAVTEVCDLGLWQKVKKCWTSNFIAANNFSQVKGFEPFPFNMFLTFINFDLVNVDLILH